MKSNIQENSIKLSDYQLGFADAETEFSRVPDIFSSCFYDPRNYINKLVNGHEFLLIGRKGIGKSAYGSRLQILSKDEQSGIKAFSTNLSSFPYGEFHKLKDGNYDGSQRFKLHWDFIILLQIYRFLHEMHYQCEELEVVRKILEKNGIYFEQNISECINKISKRNFQFKAKVPFFEIGGGIDNNDSASEKVIPMTQVVEILKEKLQKIYINHGTLLCIFDGLDDILRLKKDKIYMLSSFIRSVDLLNKYFYSNKIRIKIIILIRNDLFNSLNDPDLNKIKRDGGIELIWNEDVKQLKELVNLRLTKMNPYGLLRNWNDIFPTKIRNMDSWNYIIQHTLNRPRDILQFLKICQEVYPNESSVLKFGEIDRALKRYSEKYFFPEMKDEITGFLSDDLIQKIQSIFQRLGQSEFTFEKFKEVVSNEMNVKQDVHYYREILLVLFNGGYIGQIQETRRWDNERKETITTERRTFKHLMHNITLNYDSKFVIHRGLYKAIWV